jgi:hypothetical protein
MTIARKLLNWKRFRSDQPKVELLSRDGCHLCDEALEALTREFGSANIEVVNINSNQALEDEFVFRIPVVRFAGHVVVEGVIGPREARKAMNQVHRLHFEAGKSK